MVTGARGQLALVAVVQVLVLSLWFSASAVVPALRAEWGLSDQGAVWLTAVVQIGFAAGAVVSAVLNLADRIPPPMLVAGSALLGAGATAAVALTVHSAAAALPLRFLTGFALAGVYPVGMKIVVSWFPQARGTALGVLIGALTLGSALPQLLAAVNPVDWPAVLLGAAGLAVLGAGLCAASVRLGPHARPSPPLEPRYVLRMFADRPQRLVNLGYFGHMWELYALWAWLPAYVAASYAAWSPGADTTGAVRATAFVTIGVAGAAGCVVAGRLADRYGRALVAMVAMLVSGACGLISVAVFGLHPALVVVLLLVWGASVIADSAQFSAALSEVADPRYVGTALTAQTAIGFLLTVVTIQALPVLADAVGWRAAVPLLALGPLLGAAAMGALHRSGVLARGRA
ncbi:MAG TPA: MFS transporter [Pseudonocardia sp.]|nr:MFS transporter [Pseudonocardia sp.]